MALTSADYSWSAIVSRFAASYPATYEDLRNRYEAEIRKSAEPFRERVGAVMAKLITLKVRVALLKDKIKVVPQSQAQAAIVVHITQLEAVVNALIDGIKTNSTDMRSGERPEVGLSPVVAVVLVIGVIGLSVAGVLAALAGEKYCDSLQTRADTIDKAVQTMTPEQAAKTLADTNPPPPPPDGGGDNTGLYIGLGVLGLGAAAGAVWWASKKK